MAPGEIAAVGTDAGAVLIRDPHARSRRGAILMSLVKHTDPLPGCRTAETESLEGARPILERADVVARSLRSWRALVIARDRPAEVGAAIDH
jgi:hypothetical protein